MTKKPVNHHARCKDPNCSGRCETCIPLDEAADALTATAERMLASARKFSGIRLSYEELNLLLEYIDQLEGALDV